MKPIRWLLLGAAIVLAIHGAAIADETPSVVKIGILDDLTGPYSLASGVGTVEAVKLAVADYGGKALGKPVEVVVATDQNKPDIAVAVVREWLDRDKVTAVIGLPNSASALAVGKVVQDADSVAMATASATSDLTGKGCTPNSTHWFMDTYASANSLTHGLMAQGLKSWFFITVDYNFGLTLQAEASRMITAQGGTVLGSAKHPLGETDFSSALLTAQSSKAQVIAMANAAADLDNGIKGSQEFRLEQGGQHVAAFFLNISDIVAVGQKELQGAIGVAAVYPGMNPGTLTLSHRIADRIPGKRPPTAQNLTAYEAALHYLKAVDAAGTTEGRAVMAKMKSLPVNDPITQNGSVREDGRFMRDVTVFRVKPPAASKDPFDFLEPIRVIPAQQAFRPLAEGGCPFIK
ncbi:MAG TPA: ABC transporter substrate-binding protein [Rhodopila sp.]|nr:ABC transporter substrate-binding protein [Rhodopila sp.]